MANKNNLKGAKDAAKVAKKTAGAAKKTVNTAKKGKRIAKRSGFQTALPYITILIAIVLGLCFALVKLANSEQVALIFIQEIFCGLFGGAVFFLPAVLLFTGIIWCALHLKFKKSDEHEGSEHFNEYISERKKT